MPLKTNSPEMGWAETGSSKIQITIYPLDPPGKRLHNYMERSTTLNGKSQNFEWAIFNSCFKLPEGNICLHWGNWKIMRHPKLKVRIFHPQVRLLDPTHWPESWLSLCPEVPESPSGREESSKWILDVGIEGYMTSPVSVSKASCLVPTIPAFIQLVSQICL